MERGFTLIEIIIIIVLIGIAIPPLILAVTQATRDSFRPEFATVATHLAQGKMEEITQVKFLNHSGFDKMTPAEFPAENVSVNGVNYTILSNFTTIQPGVKQVGVTAQSPGIPDITLTTWFANYTTLK